MVLDHVAPVAVEVDPSLKNVGGLFLQKFGVFCSHLEPVIRARSERRDVLVMRVGRRRRVVYVEQRSSPKDDKILN